MSAAGSRTDRAATRSARVDKPREALLLVDGSGTDIGRLYRERGVEGLRPRFSMALVRLHHRGPMTINELSEQVDVTHSAMSQTVTTMRRQGLVRTSTGTDARTRRVSLTTRGRELIPFLEQEWRATESAIAELGDELPYPLTRVATDLDEALKHKPFLNRIKAHLPAEKA